MTMIDIIMTIVMAIGIPTIIGFFVHIGRKLQILDDLKDTTDKVKTNMKVIGDVLIQSSLTDFDGGKLQSFSPIQITHIGENYLNNTGFKNIFKENKKDFFDYIENEEPKNNYDIEIASIKSVMFLFDKPYFEEIKNYLYNNPKEGKDDFVKTAGIYVRNQYLESIETTN